MRPDNLSLDDFRDIVGDDDELEELKDKSGNITFGQELSVESPQIRNNREITKELTTLRALINNPKNTTAPDLTKLFELLSKNESIDDKIKAKIIKGLKDFLQLMSDTKLNTGTNIFYIVQAIATLEGKATTQESIERFEALKYYIKNTIAAAPFGASYNDNPIVFAKMAVRLLNRNKKVYEMPPPAELINKIGETIQKELIAKFPFLALYGINNIMGGVEGRALNRAFILAEAEKSDNKLIEAKLSVCGSLKDKYFEMQAGFKELGGTLTAKEFCECLHTLLNHGLVQITGFSAYNPDNYVGNTRYERVRSELAEATKVAESAFDFDQPERLKFYPKPLLTALPYLVVDRVFDLISNEQEKRKALEDLKNVAK